MAEIAAQAAVPARGRARAALQRAAEHARTPLHRDAYALVANSGFTALTGLLYWVVAAKAFSAHDVGLNSALISSMMFLAGLAGLNLSNVVVRFLPEAGRQAGRMIALCYGVTAAIAALAATVFVVGVDGWAPRLASLVASGPLALWFVVATVAWTLFVIQDGVLTGLGRATWVPLENAAFSVIKLAALAGAAVLLPRSGIFVSWTAAMVLSVVVVNVLVFGRLTRRAGERAAPAQISLGDSALRRYLVTDFAGAMAWMAAINLLPVVVTAAAGATTNAYFALAWAVAFPIYTVGANVGTSLVLHGAADRSALPALVRKAAVQGLGVVVGVVVLLVLLAPVVLSLFGPEYREHGTTLLRVLAIGAVPSTVVSLGVSVARVERRLPAAVIALTVNAVLTLALAVPFLHAFGVVGPGLAWLAGLSVAAGVLVVAHARRRLGLAARGEDLRARLGTAVNGGRARAAQGARLADEILATMPEADAAWETWAARTDSDVVVRFAGPRPEARLVVKIAWSPAGAAALAKQRDALAALRTAPALGALAAVLPRELAAGDAQGHPWVVEHALAGVDARRWTRDATIERALEATARGVAPLHTATGAMRTMNGTLLDALIDERLAHLDRVRGPHQGLRRLRAELREALDGRDMLVARSHGDLWLGNALLAPDASALTGLVDWEASRPADLPGVDLAHLVISTRTLVRGASLGRVVQRLLSGAEPLSPLEERLLAPHTAPGGPGVRELVLLGWLQHAAQRLTQSELHRHGLWLRRTVDPVLAGLRG